MSKISTLAKAYGLPVSGTAALIGLIYGYYEGRIKTSEIEVEASKRLTNSICCTGSGMQNFDERLETVLATFRKFNAEHKKEARSTIKRVVR